MKLILIVAFQSRNFQSQHMLKGEKLEETSQEKQREASPLPDSERKHRSRGGEGDG